MQSSPIIPTQYEASNSNVCSCANSVGTVREAKGTSGASNSECPFGNPCVDSCSRPKSQSTPHQVKRKKYRQGDLSTVCLQCNYEVCEQLSSNFYANAQAKEVQCDLESEDDDSEQTETICSICKCSSGFCNPQCASKKMKMAERKSDTWNCKNQNNSMPKKNHSAPGLGQSLVLEPKTTCKCIGKCPRECEDMKMVTAMAQRSSKTSKNLSKCKENKCHSACSKYIQTDEEEPIAPLASVETESKPVGPPPNPQSSSVCIACQCTGICSVACTMNKEGIHELFNLEESEAQPETCAVCDCSGECNRRCEKAKQLKKKMDKVCDECKCTGKCSEECTNKKEKDRFQPSSYMQTAPQPNTANVGVACDICTCSGECNEACSKAKAAKGQETKPVCEQCECPNTCNETCEAIKIEARRICDECVCNATCLPKCDEKKRQKADPPKICEICACCGQCITKECELLRVKAPKSSLKEGRGSTGSAKEGRVSRVSIDPSAISNSKSKTSEQETTDTEASEITEETKPEEIPFNETDSEATQLKGIIENFDDNNITNDLQEVPILPEDKSKSSCNVAGEVICEPCECTGECNSKCAAVRKIKSVGEFPPADAVCEICKCIDKCTKSCERKKMGITCLTSSGQPIKCDDKNPDWIPCISCNDGKPCSPECRERKALASVMPPPPEPLSGGEVQFSKPVEEEISCAVQTSIPPVTCRKVQTCFDRSDDVQAVGRTTSTANSNIRKTQDDDVMQLPPCIMKLPPCVQQLYKEKHGSKLQPPPCMNPTSSPRTPPGKSRTDQSSSCDKSQPQSCLNPPPPLSDQNQSCLEQSPESCIQLPPCLEPLPPCAQPPPCISEEPTSNECGMCQKLRQYLCSVFHNEPEDRSCKSSDRPPKRSIRKPVQLREICDCLLDITQSQQNSSASSCLPPMKNDSALCPCKLSPQPRGSYTDKMQNMMGQMRARCEDAEIAASPFIKAASVFELSVHNQQEAIINLLHKCKQKDNYIDALIDELTERSKSMVFDELLIRLHEPSANSPDFDRILISNALDKNTKRGNVCGIDLSCFKITSVKRVGATSLLVKWRPPVDNRVCGYEILVNGQLKMKVSCKERLYTILEALDFSSTIAIENFAMTRCGRAFPCALAYYAKY